MVFKILVVLMKNIEPWSLKNANHSYMLLSYSVSCLAFIYLKVMLVDFFLVVSFFECIIFLLSQCLRNSVDFSLFSILTWSRLDG